MRIFVSILIITGGFGGWYLTRTDIKQSIDKETNLIIEKSPQGEIQYKPGEIVIQFKGKEINLKKHKGKEAAKEWGETYGLFLDDTLSSFDLGYFSFDGNHKKLASIRTKILKDPNVSQAIWNYQLPLAANKIPTALNGTPLNDPAAKTDLNTQWYKQQWYIHKGTQIADAWKYISTFKKSQEEVVIAVIDSGIDLDHPDLAESLWDGRRCKNHEGKSMGGCKHGYDFYQDDLDPSHEYKLGTQDDHGTHVSGIIGMMHNNNVGGAGIAPNVKIMSLKVTGSDNKNQIDLISVQKAIGFAIQNKADIINLSFGATFESCKGEYEPWFKMMRNLYATFPGLLFAAAGNEGLEVRGSERVTFPGSYGHRSNCFAPVPNLINVGASNETDTRAMFGEETGSNYGDVTVMAPGYWIYGPVDPQSPNRKTKKFQPISGTSSASPLMAGIAGLLKGFWPNIQPSTLKNILIKSGDSIEAFKNGITKSGKRVNALNAIKALPILETVTQNPDNPRQILLQFTVPIKVTGTPKLSWENGAATYISGTNTKTLTFSIKTLPPKTPTPYKLKTSRGSLKSSDGLEALLIVREVVQTSSELLKDEFESVASKPRNRITKEKAPVISITRIKIPPSISIECDQDPRTNIIEYPKANGIDRCRVTYDPGDEDLPGLYNISLTLKNRSENVPEANTQTSFHQGLTLGSPQKQDNTIIFDLRALAPSLHAYGNQLACFGKQNIDIIAKIRPKISTDPLISIRKEVSLRFDPMHTVNPTEPKEIIIPGKISLNLEHEAHVGSRAKIPGMKLFSSLSTTPKSYIDVPQTGSILAEKLPTTSEPVHFWTTVNYNLSGKSISYPAGYIGPDPSQIPSLNIAQNHRCEELLGKTTSLTISLIGAQVEGAGDIASEFQNLSIPLKNPLAKGLGAKQIRANMRESIWPHLNQDTVACPGGNLTIPSSTAFQELWNDKDTVVFENCEVKIGKVDSNGLIPKIRIKSGRNSMFIKNGNIRLDANLIYSDINDSLGVALINDESDSYSGFGNIMIHPNVREFAGTYFIDGGLFGYDGTNIDNEIQRDGILNTAMIINNVEKNSLNQKQLVLTGNLISNNTLGGYLIKGNQLDLKTPYFSAWEQQTSPTRAIQYDLHYIRRFDDHKNPDFCRRLKDGSCDENSMAFVIRNDRRAVYVTPPGFDNISDRNLGQ